MTEKKDFEDIFDRIDFDQFKKETENVSPGERDEMIKDFLFNFPIEDYANTINQIFKIFKGTRDHHAFVTAMREHLKNKVSNVRREENLPRTIWEFCSRRRVSTWKSRRGR